VIKPDKKIQLYTSAKRRFMVNTLAGFLAREVSRTGPQLSRMLAERMVELFESLCPPTERVQPGQMVWLTLDRNTRAGSKSEALRTTVLTVVSEEDVAELAAGKSVREVRRSALRRVLEEAIEQGAVLSSRDLGLIFHRTDSMMSSDRIAVEKQIGRPLPHTGSLHDIGTTITHKVEIIRKVICERMDPAAAANATRHSQRAVDVYLKAFHRVRTLYEFNADHEFITQVTGMSKRLVQQYINIIESIEKP